MKDPMEKVPFYIRLWLVLVITGTLIMALVYAAVLQDLRMTANDTPVQIIQEVTDALKQGANPQAIVPPTPTDISTSYAPFVIVYDKDGKDVAASTQLNGKTPSLPNGITDYANKHTDDRFSWQPAPGVRIAAVLTKYSANASSTGYVLAGQSLKQTEEHIHQQLVLVMLAWLAMVVVSFLASFIFLSGHESKHHPVEHHHEIV